MSCSGTLKKFMEGKGFGFIENADGSGDVFVHFSQLNSGGSEDMVEGSKMTFDIQTDERSGKDKATNVTITEPGSGGGCGGGGYGGGGGYDSYGGGKGKGGKDSYGGGKGGYDSYGGDKGKGKGKSYSPY
ncbi:unnamed protein product [Polarella glacialis]|uniref:CSD domain-containing protein n=1 Tax=Polarella glacialis TaxID=89957 RepID=A0A813KX20_POLGL|nr:unnamed protein product [Polarella glacialis]